MIYIVNKENRDLFRGELAQMHQHRRVVFVDRLGWRLPVTEYGETDAYDRDDTLYMLLKAPAGGPVLASARLLPTEQPHLMSDLFADACAGPCPRGPTIWEASRFCPAPGLGPRARLHSLWEVLCGILETSLLFGIEQIVFTANTALLPLMVSCGWDAHVLGPTLADGSDQITALRVQVDSHG
ncbi:MAG TPA: acyl-homoserine-lactone synthase, partial [Steroidobacteraceae bacterium]